MSETTTPMVTLADIEAAAQRITGVAIHTPVLAAPHPGDQDRLLWCKAESLQPTGAFKVRGAANAILASLDRARAHGVVAQSSGNHARAVAWIARRLGLHAVIVMPDVAPPVKIAAVRALGIEVELVPADERDTRPLELVAEHGYVHVPPYDHPHVVAGQGTVGLELATDLPDAGTVLIPVSGGGLISGTATALRALRPNVRIVGVEPELAGDAAQSLREGRLVRWTSEQTYRTIADGLRTVSLGELPWRHVQRDVDEIVTVTEDQILASMRHLTSATRLVVEPSGAVAAAAWFHDLVPDGRGRTAAIVSGGQVDPALLARILADPAPGPSAS